MDSKFKEGNMGIDFKDMYLGRIDQINIDIKKAVWAKDWKLKAKLEAEKKLNQDRIKKLG